jgi:glycosyltransferase involved in cell wall biosynthesis
MLPRKIAYLTPLYFDEKSCLGGGERYPLNMATGVVEASGGATTVELISYGERSERATLRPGVSLRVLAAANRPKDRMNVLSWELPAAIADAELVHIHSPFARSSEFGLLAARQQHKPVCITDHGGVASTIGLNLGSLELADRVVAYSDFGASLLWTKTPIEVIKGGVDAALFTPPAEPVARDRMLYVGRILPHKGIDQLITALPPGMPLTVCGRDTHKDYSWLIRNVAITQGKTVEFVGDADDQAIRVLYHRSWATILPSVYQDCFGGSHVAPELMGLTLLESMASGTPAIGSRVGAMPEFIRDGETGFTYDRLDQLTEHLTRLADEPDLVEQMGQRAREVVVRDYDLRVAGRRLLDVYRDVAAQYRENAA